MWQKAGKLCERRILQKEWNPRDKYFMFLIKISRKKNVTIKVSVLLDFCGTFGITALLSLIEFTS